MKPLWKVDHVPFPRTPFEPGTRHDVIVVGAGLTGLTTAFMLARAGMDVAVIEAGEIAALASGANTGKLSLLQGQQLARLREHHPASLVRAYVDANRAGMQWLTDFADSVGVSYSRRTDHTYAQTSQGLESVRRQHEASREAGLATRLLQPGDLPAVSFPVAGAVALDDQVAIDPVQVARAQAGELVAAGGALHLGIRVTGVHALPTPRVDTTSGPVFAQHIVLATGTPITDRGLYFAKVHGLRSYCVSFRIPGPLPDGMFISVDGSTRSIRPISAADGPEPAQLIVGGNGHPVGRSDAETAEVEDLVSWTREHFPGAEETHRWSAQDYESHNLVPFVGAMPRGLGRIRFATGYGKWGLSNAPAAALRLVAEILGTPRRDRPTWMATIGTRMTVPADIKRAANEGAKVAGELAKGWIGAEKRSTPLPRPAEGTGSVGNRGGCPVAISTVDGVTRAVDAVCPHMGGILDWNDAERTWDCPLHASRFAPDGTRIEGPALRDLRRLPRSGRD
ncbi:FAD-dependent oxidoreductase [Microbacterium sp. NPDC056234]|uniref:FAD-dependent oxidoreductase n=1 Tax=Microbacterium sp. NPDC056234 TaxID=3345757 RepID=UPI0035DFE9D0